mgnify:CR=1 FL=1
MEKLFSRHTPKGLEKYKDLKKEEIEKMSNQEKFDFLDKEYDKAGRNEFRYAKKKAKKGEDFDKLIEKYNDDPGMVANPDGYTFTKNQMVKEFSERFFPLTKDYAESDEEWRWGMAPLPWEGEC